jgi:hypothetical protein
MDFRHFTLLGRFHRATPEILRNTQSLVFRQAPDLARFVIADFEADGFHRYYRITGRCPYQVALPERAKRIPVQA